VSIQQGNQVVLNGRSISALWSQRQQRIGLADTALMQAIGADLLNSQQPTAQPVQWFSQPATEPLSLSTWLTAQYRYLDITDLAQRYGWQVQPNGGTLAIRTPAARVTAVRQGDKPGAIALCLTLIGPRLIKSANRQQKLWLQLMRRSILHLYKALSQRRVIVSPVCGSKLAAIKR
jgi:hypothetical protein